MAEPAWHDLGAVDDLRTKGLHEVVAGRTRLAVTAVSDEVSVISGVCNHV